MEISLHCCAKPNNSGDIYSLQCAILLQNNINLFFLLYISSCAECTLEQAFGSSSFSPSLSFQSGASVVCGSAPSLSAPGGRNHTVLRWSTPNQTVPHRPTPPSWASNGSPGHPDTSPAPTRTSSSALLIIGSSGPHSPPFLSPRPALWEHGGHMCPDEHVLICGPRLTLRQRPLRINSFISLKRRRGENQLTGCF